MDLQKVIRVLEQDAYVVRISPPNFSRDQMPEINEAIFCDEKVDPAMRLVGHAKAFLCDTYLLELAVESDRYWEARQYFKDAYGSAFEAFQEKSRLRVNRVLPVCLMPGTLARNNCFRHEPSHFTCETSGQLKDLYGDYPSKSNQEKIESVDEISTRLYNLLRHFKTLE